MEGSEVAVMREGGGRREEGRETENNVGSPERHARLPAAATQLERSSWLRALNLSFSIDHVNLRGGDLLRSPRPFGLP